jgi:hypothetical protein
MFINLKRGNMHETKKLFSLFIIGFFLSCLGQAPTPEETLKPEPTESPSPTPTITAVPTIIPPTVVPTTVPPTVKPTGTPTPQVDHWGIYVPDTPELRSSEAYKLYESFVKEVKDNDNSDLPFSMLMIVTGTTLPANTP